MADHLRYAMLIRTENNETLIEGSICENPRSYAKEAQKIKEKMIEVDLKPNERKKITSKKHGNWLCECDANNILVICLIEEGYPERLGYAFINEIRKSVSDIPNYYGMTAKEMDSAYRTEFDNLSKKYNDPNSIDKLSSVNSKVDLATSKMQDNLKQALENQQDMTNVKTKSEGLLNMAKDYNDNADELRKIMYWRNMKLKMIMGVMGGAGVFALVLPIIQKFST